jgi:NAD(P)-dependent dehydrogenase (short-subunit alcohol dehydrogenase family)
MGGNTTAAAFRASGPANDTASPGRLPCAGKSRTTKVTARPQLRLAMPEAAFTAKTTADEAVAGRDLSGRTVIVTGANTGIGYETARALARAGARVVLGCRADATGTAAAQRINETNGTDNARFAALDLASAQSIRAFCEGLAEDRIDILICNAGLITTRYETTAEGLEKTVGVCHFGHFLLTSLLLPKLLASDAPRVVMVSSVSHKSPARLDFENFPLPAERWRMMTAYGQAKLANVLMANALQRRYGAQGLTACSLHPGTLITTDIGRRSALLGTLMKLISPFTKSPSQGASTTIHCALAAPEAVAGRYFSDCRPAKMSDEAADPNVADRLWSLSESWAQSLPT